MPNLVVGTSGWAYASWKPAFYPPKLASAKFLAHYATQLTGVEVNYTFRRMLTEKTQTNWNASTPKDFVFALKAHQAITHYKRLKDTEESVRGFLQALQPLASEKKLGPVLFQLPPNLKADVPLLSEFLQTLPGRGQLRSAFEFRHESWFADSTYDVLRAANAALCLAESENVETPEVFTADFSYYRFRRPEYSAEERERIADKLAAQRADGRDVFAFFKHEETPESALWAVEVLQRARTHEGAGLHTSS